MKVVHVTLAREIRLKQRWNDRVQLFDVVKQAHVMYSAYNGCSGCREKRHQRLTQVPNGGYYEDFGIFFFLEMQ
jgi:hypothetical protein